MRPRAPFSSLSWPKEQYSTSRPPEPRAYKPTAPEDRISRHPSFPEEAEKPARYASILWPFGSTASKPESHIAEPIREPKDLQRGIEASRRFVREGIVDPRYKAAGRKYTALICALPVALYLSYELYRRRFWGVEQRRLPGLIEEEGKEGG